MVSGQAMDLRNAMVSCFYGAQTSADVEAAAKGPIGRHVNLFETYFQSTGNKWAAGNELTYADFFLAEHLEQLRILMPDVRNRCLPSAAEVAHTGSCPCPACSSLVVFCTCDRARISLCQY